MGSKRLWLHVRKDAFKFSCAHMTVFADGSKEPLHGHNYQVSLRVEVREAVVDQLVDFNIFKDRLKEICDEYDDMVLIQAASPLAQVSSHGDEVEVILCGRRYVFPKDEVNLLAVVNITAEVLAARICEQMWESLQQSLNGSLFKLMESVEVCVEETHGQGATFAMSRL